MNLHRYPVWLLAPLLSAFPLGCFALEDEKSSEPERAAPSATNPAEAAAKAPTKAAQPVKPPAESELRAVIDRGLGFLAKEGDQWMADKNCNACHHMPELLWSHREAQSRGFTIDRKKFEEWLDWSVERATNTKPGLEEAAFMILALPERSAPELTKLLADAQKPDGSWDSAGQFASMQKRGAPDAKSNTLCLNLLALATPNPAPAESETARAKADALLKKKTAPTTIETQVYRILYARRLGASKEAADLCAAILKQQRGDGGWSLFIGGNQSDPLATGHALYALQPASSDPKTAQAIARAQQWLANTQRDDGSWPIDITHISKTDRSAPEKAKSFKEATGIYTYWGSSWATIGLLQGVPVKQP